MTEALTIYTVGHSTRDLDEFVSLLSYYGIGYVVDARSNAYSKYVPAYNKDSLREYLKDKKINYLFLGREIGARRNGDEQYSDNGKVDFSKVLEDNDFKCGIERIESGVKKGYKIAIMCSEKEPFDCHRFALISRQVSGDGFRVIHLIEPGKEITNEELEDRMIKKYKINTDGNLFHGPPSRKDVLKEAYEKRGLDVAYKKGEEDE